MIIIDNNVAVFINLISKIIKLNYERTIWKIRFHPYWMTNPISKWRKLKQYERTVEELAQEFLKNQKNDL